MSGGHPKQHSVVGLRMRSLRERLGWSQERVGVAIGIEESSSRARISRYELGVHAPPLPIARRLAEVLGVPLAYLFCDDDELAELLLALHRLERAQRAPMVHELLAIVRGATGRADA